MRCSSLFFFPLAKWNEKVYFALLFISAAAWHSPLPQVGHTSRCFTCPLPHAEAEPKLLHNPWETLQPHLWHTINSKGLQCSMRGWSLNGNQTFHTETCCEEKQDSTLKQCRAIEFGKRSTIQLILAQGLIGVLWQDFRKFSPLAEIFG